MDSLSTAYDFTMRDYVVDIDAMDRPAVSVPTPRASLFSVETILDGIDAVAAVYEPAGR